MNALRYPRFGETGDLHQGQMLEHAQWCDFITTRRHPGDARAIREAGAKIVCYDAWPVQTTPHARIDHSRLDWSLIDQLTYEATRRGHLLRTNTGQLVSSWDKPWIDLRLAKSWWPTVIARWCEARQKDRSYNALMGAIPHRIAPVWRGNQMLPPSFDAEWSEAVYEIMQHPIFDSDWPFIGEGDAYSVHPSLLAGVKIEDLFTREQDFKDEIWNRHDPDNRNLRQAHFECQRGSRYTICALHEAWLDAPEGAVWPFDLEPSRRLEVATAIVMIFSDAILTFGSHRDEAKHQAHLERARTLTREWMATSPAIVTEWTRTGEIFGRRHFRDRSDTKHTVTVFTKNWEVTGL